jgi:hypothetical protein
MSTVGLQSKSRFSRLGWGIHLGMTGLLALNSIILYFVIAGSREEQTTAILLGGFGFLALVVALEGFRRPTRWGWNALWVVTGALSLIGIHILVFGEPVVGGFYLFLAGVAFVGQVLAGSGLAKSK